VVNYKGGVPQDENQSWTPMKALGTVRRKLASDLQVSSFDVDISGLPKLPLGDYASVPNDGLESYLAMFGGYTSYLEAEVAKLDSTLSALQAAFDDGLAKATHKIATEREAAGKKKPTREELRGEALNTYTQLWELRKEVIETDAALRQLSGTLKAYDKAYASVSRVVGLRTMGDRQR